MKNILIIDDEKILAAALLRALERKLPRGEFAVHQINSSTEAIQHISAHSDIDLIFLDYLMPELNGGDVLDWVKKTFPKIKVVLMTAYGDQDTKDGFIRRGALHVLSKPFDDILKISDLALKILAD